MQLTIRTKLMTVVAVTTAAMLVLVVASGLLARHVDSELGAIRTAFLPRMELGPRLENGFEELQRALQDAVGAHDADALEATRKRKGDLEALVTSSKVFSPAESDALKAALDDYYSAAADVSRRMMAGETGEDLPGKVRDMQSKRGRVRDLIREDTSFDREQLAAAFSGVERTEHTASRLRITVSALCLAVVFLLSVWMGQGILSSLRVLSAGIARFGTGDFADAIPVSGSDEIGDVARRANEMARSLDQLGRERDRVTWLKEGQAGLANELRGELEPAEVASLALRFLTGYLGVPAAVFYVVGADHALHRLAEYGVASGAHARESIEASSGIVGQAALRREIVLLRDLPPEHFRIVSGLGDSRPRGVALVPLPFRDDVTGVLEIAFVTEWQERASELMLAVRESLAITLEAARAGAETRRLLKETQRQAEELARQEESLRGSNEELESQQEELRQTNEELARQAEELEQQRRALEDTNHDLEGARSELEKKAEELSRVSRYKSQFLANMSHELRTPLNSMLLLSQLLAENDGGNLDARQVEFARTIHAAGKDLLALINQVLDLAKVEAGKQRVQLETVPLEGLVERARRVFGPLARDKGLEFVAEVEPGAPEVITTDRRQLEQIINNLVANAIKFTDQGRVGVHIRPATDRDVPSVAITVVDTGVGIASEHQARIFAPFEQVDGASDRRFGGTGLGLSIARELSRLLGGDLTLESTPGAGSVFTCVVPVDGAAHGGARVDRSVGAAAPIQQEPAAQGERPAQPLDSIAPVGADCLLIIEDDPRFAATLGDVIRDLGFHPVIAADGERGIEIARRLSPRGIVLDVRLPKADGFAVMETLRADPATSSIPVHFISAADEAERGLAMGAIGYLTKPVSREDLMHVVESLTRSERAAAILVVGCDGDEVLVGIESIAGDGIDIRRVSNARDALAELAARHFACVILDLALPDMDGLRLVEELRSRFGNETPALLVYTARPLTRDEAKRLNLFAQAVVVRDGASEERLLGEIRLFIRNLRTKARSAGRRGTSIDRGGIRLEGRRILVADDDMRTVYALSATLRAKGADVLVADTGAEAIRVLGEQPGIEVVLMDIMMPEMDGYEAMRRIRADPRFSTLAIIALTAKAMKGDEERCIAAGATAYLPKPIDPERLLVTISAEVARTPRADG